MKSYMICNYCNNRWEKGYVSKYCPKCHDTNIRTEKSSNSSNINYYEGSPEFINPKKIKKDKYDDYL